jgi:hypothetical protein
MSEPLKRALRLYALLAPLILAPLAFYLWWRVYRNLPQVLLAWLLPVLWAYIVPAYGTNVRKVWEFDARWRWGRFRPQHGFVFGSATALLACLAHGAPASSLGDVLRFAFVLCPLLGFWNWLYDIKALESGILRVYNPPWAEGAGAAAIASDYAPWIFGGFGAAYGLIIGALEWRVYLHGMPGWLETASWMALGLAFAIALPILGFMRHSQRRHGHFGTRPVDAKPTESPCEKP